MRAAQDRRPASSVQAAVPAPHASPDAAAGADDTITLPAAGTPEACFSSRRRNIPPPTIPANRKAARGRRSSAGETGCGTGGGIHVGGSVWSRLAQDQPPDAVADNTAAAAQAILPRPATGE